MIVEMDGSEIESIGFPGFRMGLRRMIADCISTEVVL